MGLRAGHSPKCAFIRGTAGPGFCLHSFLCLGSMASSPFSQILQFSLGSLLHEDLHNPSILPLQGCSLAELLSSHKLYPTTHLLKTRKGSPLPFPSHPDSSCLHPRSQLPSDLSCTSPTPVILSPETVIKPQGLRTPEFPLLGQAFPPVFPGRLLFALWVALPQDTF